MSNPQWMTRRRAATLLLLVGLVGASGCTTSDRSAASAPRADGDCGAGGRDSVVAARELMDSKVPNGPAVFRGAADVCGVDEIEVRVGRTPPPHADPTSWSSRASASVFFAPTVLVGEPGQQLTLLLMHDGKSRTHNFTIEELGINELLFSSDTHGIGSQKSVTVEFPTDGEPLLFYCRFHKTGGMWGALVTH